MTPQEKCFQLLKNKLVPQRARVQGMGFRWVSSFGPQNEKDIEFEADYRLQNDILMEYENQYSKLLDEVKLELRNNQ